MKNNLNGLDILLLSSSLPAFSYFFSGLCDTLKRFCVSSPFIFHVSLYNNEQYPKCHNQLLHPSGKQHV